VVSGSLTNVKSLTIDVSRAGLEFNGCGPFPVITTDSVTEVTFVDGTESMTFTLQPGPSPIWICSAP
jgi:hypothetical protein